MIPVTTVPDWFDDAECVNHDPELFHPTYEADARFAIAICKTCPVAAQCLAYAMSDVQDIWGVWGGTTFSQRRRALGKSRRHG